MVQNECTSKFCGSVKAKNLNLSNGVSIKPTGVSGPLVAKIPVVLGQTDVQIDLETDVKLKDDFYEIKRIKKDVFLTQCRLMPTAGMRDKRGNLISGKLFLQGYIKKNIEYATAKCSDEDDVVSGNIKHTTVKVPFKCITEVIYDRQPIIKYRSNAKEIEYFDDNVSYNNKCQRKIKGKSNCEQDFEEIVYYTEKPYCELEEARIFEADLHKEPLQVEGITTFNKVTEKLVLFLRIKVLQVQQVNILNKQCTSCDRIVQNDDDDDC